MAAADARRTGTHGSKAASNLGENCTSRCVIYRWFEQPAATGCVYEAVLCGVCEVVICCPTLVFGLVYFYK